MLRSALPRILGLFAGVLGVTVVLSLALGALVGSSLLHALATGFYIVGVAILLGSFGVGIRGPVRADWGEGGRASGGFLGGFLPRGVRRASADERVEGKRNSVGLFLFGMVFLVIGVAVDPSRRLF